MTTVVRPSEADLSAIARRISGPLSPEGAESWYRNDSAMLLQEITTLRAEAEAARRSFIEDGVQGPDVTLYELARAWKATATGFWEKTQTRRLRQKVAELTQDAESLRDSIQMMREEYEQNVLRLSAQYAEREAQAKDLMARAAELL